MGTRMIGLNQGVRVLVGLIIYSGRSSARSGTRARETARAFIIVAGRTEVRATRLLLAHITHVRTRMRGINQRMSVLVGLIVNGWRSSTRGGARTRETRRAFIIVAGGTEISAS